MKLWCAALVILLSRCERVSVSEQKPSDPLKMDCSKNPICPEGKTCTCLPGTYHPEPSFMVDDRYGEYKFEIHLEKGWDCKPDVAKDKGSLTVTCKKGQS